MNPGAHHKINRNLEDEIRCYCVDTCAYRVRHGDAVLELQPRNLLNRSHFELDSETNGLAG